MPERRNTTPLRCAAALLPLLLAACGQTGPLYLPEDEGATVITRPGPGADAAPGASNAPDASSAPGTPAPGSSPSTTTAAPTQSDAPSSEAASGRGTAVQRDAARARP